MTYFNWKKEPIQEVESKNHIYNGYTSVTRMLDATSDKSGLESWKERVGEYHANHISLMARSNGTKLHNAIESYLNNEEPELKRPLTYGQFMQMKGYLDNIDNIRHTEVALVSNTMKLGGTADCIAEYKGNLSLIDFKTSKKKKDLKYVQDYFLQATTYSMMYEEMTGNKIDDLVILITCEDGEVQEFIRKTETFKKPVMDRISLYHSITEKENE